MSLARGRPVYCRDPGDWERIERRAESVGLSTSEFVMACALHDGDAPAPSETLVLTAGEQRELLRMVREIYRRITILFFGRPEGGPSTVDAIALLHRLSRDGDPDFLPGIEPDFVIDGDPEFHPGEGHE